MGRTTDTTPDDAGTAALSAAIRWLRHPVSLAAIAVLVLNDHVLKAEFGSWWTGKLSDVAGLVFAPALVAVISATVVASVVRLGVGPTPRRAARWTPRPATVAATSLAVVGTLFIAAKATAVGAATASSLLGHAVGPSLLRADATDLLALPALAVSWFAFRACLRRAPSSSPSGSSRVGALLAVGVATAATLATSYIGVHNPMAVAVVPDGDGLAVKYQEPYVGPNIAFDTTTDGLTWHAQCGTVTTDPCEPAPRATPKPVTSACVPSLPNVCFRVQDHRIGVDRSNNAGRTWRPEWGLSDVERGRLAAFLEVGNPDTQLASLSLGIVDGQDGFVVVVANGFDGLAIRDASGSWERRGFLDSDCCSSATPPIDVSAPLGTVAGFPAGPALAAAAWGFAFAIALLATRTRAGAKRRTGFGAAMGALFRWIAGAILMAGGLLLCCAWVFVAARTHPANPDRVESSDPFMYILVGVVTAIGVATIFLGGLAAPLWRWRLTRRAVLGASVAATVGTIAALVAGAGSSEWRLVATVTGVAVLVALVPAIAIARWRAARDTRPTQPPPWLYARPPAQPPPPPYVQQPPPPPGY